MLFHVTATHNADDCPIFNPDKRDAARQAAEGMANQAQEMGVTVHFSVTGAPEHVVYSLLEADKFETIASLLAKASVFPQDFRITPVTQYGNVAQTVLRDEG
jgi:muconolactone delta-isomerase